ncbi:MAG: cation:proton antiporter [Bacteroidales bacterium]|nr:cation:proton antiporter [Bacteroidales bacterium]
MLDSLAELLIVSMLVTWLFRKIRIPELVGILFVGVLFGPYLLNLIDPSLLDISGELRLGALIVILLRAGLELTRDSLNRVGRPALLLSFIPAIFEGGMVTLLAPSLLGLTWMEGAILGSILGAVSPAVVVPFMIRFMQQKRGTKKGIPTLVLAASSLDDVFVIVIYSIFIGIYTGQQVQIGWALAGIPISIILGIAIGLAAGWILCRIFDRYNPRATRRVLILMAVSILLIRIEHLVEQWIPFAALLSVMAIGFFILEKRESYAHELSTKLAKIWIMAEIILFTMVGAQVNLEVAFQSGLAGIMIILAGLVARSAGTIVSLIGTSLNMKEKAFVVIAYIPKATVQAAIGAAPLMAMRLARMPVGPGETILAVAVLSIILTAPLGAWGIAVTGKRWLE